MRRRAQYYLLSLLFLLSANISYAEIKLPGIISSNMVLQRNTWVTLWGWADAGEKIILSASWLSEEIKIAANNTGDWEVRIKTTDSKAPQSIQLTNAKSDIRLENILFGEVWLCSGQSNMEQKIKGYYNQPTFGAQQAVTTANNNNLRLFNVELWAAETPQDTLGKYKAWQSASPESVKEFSAIAYFYGQQLQQILDVPVGMIHTSWGGSLIEAWISNDVLSTLKEVDLSEVDLKRGNRFPTVLFNAMLNPLIPYTIKGALWYQGEANASRPEEYKKLFPAMVKDWRTRWSIGDFPFYYVQIAPFEYNWEEENYLIPLMREAQFQCLDLIPNSGIAITLDIGEERIIHPPKKKEVADRLLYNALNKTYGYESIDYSGPVLDSIKIRHDSVLVSFKHAEQGLYSYDGLEGFEVAGENKTFYPATATIYWDGILVRSENVKEPVAVRYGWRSWVRGTLFDTNLLPASSFRSDNWEME